MKKVLSLICLALLCFASRAQLANSVSTTANVSKADVLQVKETTHNFGKIPQGRPATYTFEITNTSNEPLTLENVQASCGCTTPEWSKEPIAPGASANIKVGYNAYAEGLFNKTVTIL